MGSWNPDVDATQISPVEPIGSAVAQAPVMELIVVDGSLFPEAIMPS
jgi:hypothetical protein